VSEQNVELHRRVYEAFNARDVEGLIACLDPSIEWNAVLTVPGGAVYSGHNGIRRWFRDHEDAWGDQIRVQPETYFDLGEQTLALVVLQGRGRQSGAEVAMPNAQVFSWRDGLAVYYQAYIHKEDALRDLRVAEDVLEPIAP
jgi:ketosteroid isomerase-like protein